MIAFMKNVSFFFSKPFFIYYEDMFEECLHSHAKQNFLIKAERVMKEVIPSCETLGGA